MPDDDRETWWLPSPHGEGTLVFNAHARGTCASGACALHSPSDHAMRDWPLRWEYSTARGGAMLRVCPHGELLADPDDAAFRRDRGMAETGTYCPRCGLGNPPF